MSVDRFNCYIKGGIPQGTNRYFEGCRDKSFPIAQSSLIINRELFFAKESNTWNKGGVCFLSNQLSDEQTTKCFMYLITEEQFIDVVNQENENLILQDFDFEACMNTGSTIIENNLWYDKILLLGYQDEKPIFTFTNQNSLTSEINKPSLSYLNVIIHGLVTSLKMAPKDIVDYLQPKKGITGMISESEIMDMAITFENSSL